MKRRGFFDAMRALLPRSRAFDITQSKQLRRLVSSIAPLPDGIRDDLEAVLLDYYPETTRALDRWEETFRVQFSRLFFTMAERRNVISAFWWMRYGNTTAQFMEKVLGLFIPGVRVTDNVPVANARGLQFLYLAVCDNEAVVCDGENAVCDLAMGDRGVLPSVLRNDTMSPYDLPIDERYWATCFFVSGDVLRDVDGKFLALDWLSINVKWRRFIEYIILALKPVHTTAVLFFDYNEEA